MFLTVDKLTVAGLQHFVNLSMGSFVSIKLECDVARSCEVVGTGLSGWLFELF